jgi:hypothetical protein
MDDGRLGRVDLPEVLPEAGLETAEAAPVGGFRFPRGGLARSSPDRRRRTRCVPEDTRAADIRSDRGIRHASGVATITAARSDVFPVGTSVGAYVAAAKNPGQAPGAPAIASASVAADGSLTITNAGIASLTPYVLAAQVNGTWQYIHARSTLDTFDRGTAVGTADTTNGSASLANVTASSGAFAVGQRINGAGIPSGTRLISGSGAAWVMSATATATASTVPVVTDGGRAPAANLGATAIPSRASTPWQVQLRQRRSIAGTS